MMNVPKVYEAVLTMLHPAPHTETPAWISKDPGAGGHRRQGSTSFATIYATFIPVFITAVIYIVIFIFVRQSYRNIYVPRTYMTTVPANDRTPPAGHGRLDWVHNMWRLDDKFILRHQSLDAYLFLRFFRMVVLLSLVGCCLTWPILFPINATAGGTATQLDRISFSNVKKSGRLYAHALVAWVFLGFVMLLVARERVFTAAIRQAYQVSAVNAARLSSRVVLFLSLPDEALGDDGLHKIFGPDAKRSWTVSNLDELESLVQDRNSKASELETAQVVLIRDATKKSQHPQSHLTRLEDVVGLRRDDRPVEEQSRPKHKSKPLVGKEVDTILELKTVLPELVTKIQGLRDAQKDHGDPHTAAMFVEFADQAAAHRAYQQVHHPSPLRLSPRYIGVQPKEVLWHNLTIRPSDRLFRSYMAVAFVAATIILWSIPIGFFAAISNVSYMTDKVKFLRFLNRLPDPILGFLQGFLPPYVVSEVVSYVPKLFRNVAKYAGAPTTPEAEARTQQWYFAFQLIQVFLVTTTASGAASVATQVAGEPSSIPTLLAQNLPTASNFYLTYFILQGTASAANNILNYSDLLEYLIYDRLFDKTPRDQYSRYTSMKGISWGSVYPKFANMAVIAIAYSCIAPLVLGFAAVGFFLYYLSYRHNLLYVIQAKLDTKGAAYSRALQHTLAGVYISELCLIGLFGTKEAKGPTILMVILLAITIIYHITLNRLITPLEQNVPVQLISGEEEAPLLSAEEGTSNPRDTTQEAPRVLKYGEGKLPAHVLNPLARFLEPTVFESPQYLKSWFHDPEHDDDIPSYTEDQLKNAYVNPAMTSNTPKFWLVRDELGISKHEIEENEKAGISATDDGASLDENGDIVWDHENLRNTPIFKAPVKY